MNNRRDHGMEHGRGHHNHMGGHEEHGMRTPSSHIGHEGMLQDLWRRFVVSLALTIPVLILSPSIQGFLGLRISFSGDYVVLWVLSSIIYVYGGYPFLKGLVEEVRRKLPGMMTLIGLAISVAYLYSSATLFFIHGKSFFWELATLIDVMLLGHIIEMKSVATASKALQLLARSLPSIAHLKRDDESIVDVPTESLHPGDLVLVKPGERVPVDGVIVEGRSSVDESMVTGESRPIPKKTGDRVLAGTINLEGSLIIRAEKTGSHTYIAQVIELVKKIQASKSRAQDLANRAAKWLTIIALSGGFLTFIAWIIAGYGSFFALERAVTVMVITCPHALGLAVPLVIARSTALAAMNGLLIKNRIGFENARNVSVVVFDKTGTLTKGELKVSKVIVFDESMSMRDLLALAASLEAHSEHPIAKAIVGYAKAHGVKIMKPVSFESLPGLGVHGVINGNDVSIVGPNFLREHGHGIGNLAGVRDLMGREQANTVVYVLVDNRIVGAILFEDEVKPESRDAVRELRSLGIEVVMLTGDNRAVAERVANELGIKRFFAEVLPHEKVDVVRRLRNEGHRVAMVGDGVNDAPALMEADVGIAIGAGTDIAIESADVVLVRSDPRDVPRVLRLSQKTYRKIVENLLWATGYNSFAIPLAAGVAYKAGILLQPAIGALLMAISTVIVSINALLLRL